MTKKSTYEELEKKIQKLDRVESVSKKAEEMLQMSKDYLSNIINTIGDPVFVKDDESRFILANDSLCEILGIERENIIGKTLGESLPDNQMKHFLKIDKLVLESGQNNSCEEILTGGDGNILTIVTKKTRYVDEQGSRFIVGTIRDITERKQTEEALRESEHKFATHLQNTPVGAISWNLDFKTVEWNPAVEAIFGYTKEEALGKHVTELILPEDMKELVDGIFQDMISEKGGVHSTNENITKDGGGIICDWYNTTLKDISGKVIGVASLVQDITERKQINTELELARNAAEKANSAKTEFLANISHEIRTPLNIVLGMGELLSETKLDEAQQQYLTSLHHAGQHLFKLINDILDFSRIESGNIEIEKEPFHLGSLLQSIEDMIVHLPLQSDVNFQLHFAPSICHERLGDAGKLKQILINLLGNAAKFTQKGKIELSVSELKSKNQPLLIFTVTDTGIGIPDERHADIFERFAQIEAGKNQSKGGVGLGLAITQRLVKAMGGNIYFTSTIGEGSSFTVELSVEESDEPISFVPDTDQYFVAPEKLKGVKLLVVDDVSQNREIIANFLEKYPVAIECAADGQGALDHYRTKQIDLILMDIRMPGMDGLTAVQIIREIEKSKKGSTIPIIAMTAHAFKEQKKFFLNAGFDEILTKPFTKQELLSVLAKNKRSPKNLPRQDRTGNKIIGSIMEAKGVDIDISQTYGDLIPALLEMLDNELKKMNHLLSEKDYSGLQESCHSMKGVAGMYGFSQLFSLLESLEKIASNQDLVFAHELCKTLSYYVEQLCDKYSSID
jgi:PAS domain S-box-containing protein